MLRGEATNSNFVVFGLTRSGIEPTIYHTRDKHVNHYTTDAVPKEKKGTNSGTQNTTLSNTNPIHQIISCSRPDCLKCSNMNC